VLLKVSGQLESTLIEVFDPDYVAKVGSARERVAEGFEGEYTSA